MKPFPIGSNCLATEGNIWKQIWYKMAKQSLTVGQAVLYNSLLTIRINLLR